MLYGNPNEHINGAYGFLLLCCTIKIHWYHLLSVFSVRLNESHINIVHLVHIDHIATQYWIILHLLLLLLVLSNVYASTGNVRFLFGCCCYFSCEKCIWWWRWLILTDSRKRRPSFQLVKSMQILLVYIWFLGYIAAFCSPQFFCFSRFSRLKCALIPLFVWLLLFHTIHIKGCLSGGRCVYCCRLLCVCVFV